MHQLHFVADFSYQPSAQEPLKLFELGDAFTAGWVTTPIGTPKKQVGQYFLEDLKMQYSNALLLQAFPSGLNLIDLSDGKQLLTYDRNSLYNNLVDDQVSSYESMLSLIKNIIQTAQKRSETARLLLISINPTMAINFDLNYDEIKTSSSLKLVNLFSQTLHRVLYDKKKLHDFAYENPIYPKTLYWNSHQTDSKELDQFIRKTNSRHYVVKPTNGTRSEGVHIIAQEKLRESIHGIKDEKCLNDLRESFYTAGILIQVCHLSKLIQFKEKFFCAKGRVVIRADFSSRNAKPVLSFLAGYWQLANQPYENVVNEKTAIAFGAANREGVVEIEKKDWLKIKELFSAHLPSILHSMATTSISSVGLDRVSSPDVKTSTAVAETSIILKEFLKRQFIFPQGSIWLQKLYLGFNLYWEDSLYRQLTKKFIIDLIGIDQSVKKYLNRDTQSIDKFINSAILTRDEKQDNPLQLTHSCSHRFNSYTINFLFLIFIALIILSKNPMILTISLLSLSGLLIKKYNDINKPDSFKSCFQDGSIMKNSISARVFSKKPINPMTSDNNLIIHF